jgi:hypothetical protein
VALCAVYTVHVETRSVGFLVEPQNQGQQFVSGLASKLMATVCEWFGQKTTRTVFTGLASKPVTTVSSGLAPKLVVTVSCGLASKPGVTVSAGLASKPTGTVSSSLASKPVVTVSWLSLKTKVVEGFPVWASKLAASFW